MNCVSESRPRLSVPSGANSEGLAKAGFCVVLIARRPASSARSGAASAIATAATRIAEPEHPGPVVAELAATALASARRRRSQAIRRAEGRGDGAHVLLTRGSR